MVSTEMSEPIKHIPLRYDTADSDASALRLILSLKPKWKESQDTIEFKKFTDGITNTLLKATNKRDGLSKKQVNEEAVLLRAYGQGTAVLIDREREAQSHSLLARHGLAPALLARFDNGLLYSYIEGDACSPADLRRPEIWRAVARKLGEWHARLPVGSSERPTQNGHVDGHANDIIPRTPDPNIWSVIHKWIRALPANTDAERDRQEMLEKELEWIVQRLGNTPGIGGRPYVFGHCDLLCGNVIISSTTSLSNPSSPSVSFIDYEYATPAPASFDLANHFSEWGGFDCDFSVLPTQAQRRDFLAQYLASYSSHSPPTSSASACCPADDGTGGPAPTLALTRTDSKQDRLPREQREPELDRLADAVDAFRGVPGFYWGVWALVQATISHIDFDYAGYARVRLGEYWAWKAEVDGSRVERGEEMPLRERRWGTVE